MSTDLDMYRPPEPLPEKGEVVDDAAYIRALYESLGIEPALDSYLDASSEIEETDVEILLARFSMLLADAALADGQLDVAIVRIGVDHLTENMNEVCSNRFGYKSTTWSQGLLIRAGVAKPQPKTYVRQLDDRYWNSQFPEEYASERQAERQPGETEQHYLARHIHQSIQGFIFAPFTYMRGYSQA